MILVFLACLVAGVTLVAAAQRRPAKAEHMERIGGAMLTAGLIGLGFVLASRR